MNKCTYDWQAEKREGKGNGKNLGIRMGGEFHAGMVDRAVQGLSRQESLR